VADGSNLDEIRGLWETGSPAQEWTFSFNNVFWEIKNGTGKTLALSRGGSRPQDGQVPDLSNFSNAIWAVEQDEVTGYINISRDGYHLALTEQPTYGRNIALWSDYGERHHNWSLVPVPPRPPKVEASSIVFIGKFNYWENALNENIFVVFPHGIVPNGLVYILGTWTITSHKSKKAAIKTECLIQLDETKTSFVADAGYYLWKGKTNDDWKTLEFSIWHQKDKVPVSTQILEVFPELKKMEQV